LSVPGVNTETNRKTKGVIAMGPSYEFPVTITRVIDGDTVDAMIDVGFKIKYAERIRLLGLDTPESRTSNKAEKILGIASKNRLKELISQARPLSNKRGRKDVILKTSKDGKGKFGRILGEIWINANGDFPQNANQALIDEGYARWYMGGSKNEQGPWVKEKNCSYNCGGKKLTRRRVCDGIWERWTEYGYVPFVNEQGFDYELRMPS
jgi:micrococcal nuclease